MTRFRRVSRAARKVYGKVRKSRASTSGMLGSVIAGAAVGVGVSFGAGTINKYVPSIGPLRPTSAALLGIGVAGKMMHKGGKFADAALIMGSAMAVTDVMGSVMGGSVGSSTSSYFMGED